MTGGGRPWLPRSRPVGGDDAPGVDAVADGRCTVTVRPGAARPGDVPHAPAVAAAVAALTCAWEATTPLVVGRPPGERHDAGAAGDPGGPRPRRGPVDGDLSDGGAAGRAVALDGVPDGVQPVQIVAEGDGTDGGSASDTIYVDRTAPRATELQGSPAAPGVVTLAWRATDATSGVVASQAQINAATDGGISGEWRDVGGPGGAGAQSVTAAPPVGDGVHAWRVVTTDAAGNTAVTAGPQPVVVNGHAPGVQLHNVPTGWVGRFDLDLTATDALQSVLGIGATEVDVNAATDGGESGEWLRRSATATPPGRRVVPVPLTGLTSGRHVVRVTVRNGGPFPSLATEVRTLLRVDLDAPADLPGGVLARAAPGR